MRIDVTENSPRVLAATRIHNLRDYGGYALAGGSRLSRGLLYRSGDPSRATDGDLDLVSRIGLSAVIDLRGTTEREAAPFPRPAGFSAPIHFADGETAHAAPHVEVADALDATEARSRISGIYAGMPFRPLLITILRRYFRALSESTGPTLVYCLAGKDRTGFAVSLLHSAVGVHHDDILEDYLLTNSAGDSDARIAAIAKDLEIRFRARLSEGALQVLAGVEAQFLDTAFDAIAARHGSVEAYLTDVLEVTPALREALRRRLVA